MTTDRWLVTGATGFIGQAVVRLALKSGIHVAALVSGGSKKRLPKEVTPIAGKLDSPDWQAIEAFAPMVCIHCAWITKPGEYLNSTENEPLVENSIRLASDLYRMGLSRFVGLGTCIEYAPSPRALNEKDPRSTDIRPYVKAKLKTLDGISTLVPDQTQFSWVRIFYPYGPGEPSEKFLPLALKTLSEGGELTLRRPADIVDYIHVADVASAICAVAVASEGGIFNVGNGQPLSVKQVAATIKKASGAKGKILENTQNETVSRFADNNRLKTLGWNPTYSLEEGICSMLTR